VRLKKMIGEIKKIKNAPVKLKELARAEEDNRKSDINSN
jgi:hypothetical protein